MGNVMVALLRCAMVTLLARLTPRLGRPYRVSVYVGYRMIDLIQVRYMHALGEGYEGVQTQVRLGALGGYALEEWSAQRGTWQLVRLEASRRGLMRI